MDELPEPKKPRPGSLPAWAAVVVLLVAIGGLVGGWFYLNRPKNGIHIDDLKAEAATKLPVGTPKEEIMKWFDTKGFADVGDMKNPSGGVIGYRVLVPNDSYMEKAELEISCRFDKDGKITTVDIARIKTRP